MSVIGLNLLMRLVHFNSEITVHDLRNTNIAIIEDCILCLPSLDFKVFTQST